MNCPVCNIELVSSVYGYELITLHCESMTHDFLLNKEKEEIVFNLFLKKNEVKIIGIRHITRYINDQIEYWWYVSSVENPLDRIIGYGCNQLSPTDAYKLLQRYQKLLIFS